MRLKSGNWLNPVFLVISVWFFFLLISNFTLTGVAVASYETQLIFVFSFLAVGLGAVFSFSISNTPKKLIKPPPENNYKIIVIICLFFSIPLIPALINVFSLIYNNGYLGYLALTKWADGSENIAYGSAILASIGIVIVKPVAYSSLFLGVAYYFSYSKKTLLFLSFFMTFSISLIHSSRGQVVIYFVLFLMLIVLSYQHFFFSKLSEVKKLRKRAILLVIFFFGLLLLFSYGRSGGTLNVLDMLVKYTVGYYTLGFYLFETALQNPDSLIHGKHLGLATFSFVDFFLEQFTKLGLQESVFSIPRQIRTEMSELVPVGINLDKGEVRTANAFYTGLYPFYADFSWLGIFVFPFFYGFLLMRYFIYWKRAGDVRSLSLIFFFIWTGYNGLTMPSMLMEFWWFTFIFLLVAPRISIKK